MQQVIDSTHLADTNGNPAGGITIATGLRIDWQNGPLGRGEERLEPNGAFVETVIAAAIDRLEYYQASTRFSLSRKRTSFDKTAGIPALVAASHSQTGSTWRGGNS